jgi:hypothetical protein
MRHDEIGSPADGLAGRGDSELVGVLLDEHRAALKASLFPGEYIVWAGRGRPPRLAPIRVFPSFFAVFLCAASGFALMVLFGIYAERDISLEQKLFLLVLPPAALGCVAALGIANGWGRHRLRRRRISRSFYVLTDSRAIVGRQGRWADDVKTVEWTPAMFNGTLCTEGGDATGDVYFTCDGQVVEPEWGFEGIEQPARVETLIREVLLEEKVLTGADHAEL